MRLFLLLLGFCAPVSAQVLEGLVVDKVTGLPVGGAYVAAQGPSFNDRILAVSDPSGHFIFRPSQAAKANLVETSRPGYLRWTPPAPTFPAGTSEPIRIELTPQAVISGMLTDEDGFAVEGARVEALQYGAAAGERKLQRVGLAATSSDLGAYRIAGLPAGRYYLRVIPDSNGAWDRRYTPSYYPGSPTPLEDGMIEVAVGQERSDVSLRLTKQEGVTVAGRVILPDPSAITAYMQVIFVHATDGTGFNVAQGRWDRKTGEFTIRRIPPGTWEFWVSSSGTRGRPGDLVASQTVTVGKADITDVVLAFSAR